MLAYERSPWTDEHLNTTASPYEFQLPHVEGGLAKWRWVEGSEWKVETGTKQKENTNPIVSVDGKSTHKEDETEEDAWVYYDNKWRDGRRGQDGWGRYTRRRKWIRDAELVDIDPVQQDKAKQMADEKKSKLDDGLVMKRSPGNVFDASLSDAGTDVDTIVAASSDAGTLSTTLGPSNPDSVDGGDATCPSHHKRRSWFVRPSRSRTVSSVSVNDDGHDRGGGNASSSGTRSVSSSLVSRSGLSRDGDVLTPTAVLKEREAEWGLGDDVHMALS